jgi:hypothetical protein
MISHNTVFFSLTSVVRAVMTTGRVLVGDRMLDAAENDHAVLTASYLSIKIARGRTANQWGQVIKIP